MTGEARRWLESRVSVVLSGALLVVTLAAFFGGVLVPDGSWPVLALVSAGLVVMLEVAERLARRMLLGLFEAMTARAVEAAVQRRDAETGGGGA